MRKARSLARSSAPLFLCSLYLLLSDASNSVLAALRCCERSSMRRIRLLPGESLALAARVACLSAHFSVNYSALDVYLRTVARNNPPQTILGARLICGAP